MMITHLSFSTSEVLMLTSSFIGGILLFILSNRTLLRNIKSFEFNFVHFMIGIVLALASCFVFFNWESKEKVYTTYEPTNNDPVVMVPITTWPEKKRKLILPPPPKKEVEVILPDVPVKIKEVDKIDEVIDAPMNDIQETPMVNVDSMMAATKAVEPPPQIDNFDDDEVKIRAEQMPRFPGCEELDVPMAEKKKCAEEQLMQFIYDNLDYPQLALQNGIEGQVVARFVVEKDGSVSDIKIMRDIGGGCGNATKTAIASMNDLPEKWTPGYQTGRAVRVQFTMPVVFKTR